MCVCVCIYIYKLDPLKSTRWLKTQLRCQTWWRKVTLVRSKQTLDVMNDVHRWPKTLAGFMAFLPCVVSSSSSAPQEKRAWRRCDRSGRWAEHDYNQCSYTSQFTHSLHELTQVCTFIIIIIIIIIIIYCSLRVNDAAGITSDVTHLIIHLHLHLVDAFIQSNLQVMTTEAVKTKKKSNNIQVLYEKSRLA